MPIGISVEIILRGKLNLFLEEKLLQTLITVELIFSYSRFFKELSPVILISIFGVVDKIPKSKRAQVPELKQFMIVFFCE